MNTRNTANNFLARLAGMKLRVLLLDFDAVLALFAEDQSPELPRLISCLHKIVNAEGTRAILLTKNSAQNLKSRLNMHPSPEIWGNDALERLLPDGAYHTVSLGHEQSRALKAAQYAVTNANLGSCLEQNPGSLTLRWKGLSAPAARHARNLAFHAWNQIVQTHGLLLQEFEGGMELRSSRNNTADAIRAVTDELDEHGMVVYLGDDQVENVLGALREQDLVIHLSREQQDASANLWIESYADLLHFFSAWLSACGPMD